MKESTELKHIQEVIIDYSVVEHLIIETILIPVTLVGLLMSRRGNTDHSLSVLNKIQQGTNTIISRIAPRPLKNIDLTTENEEKPDERDIELKKKKDTHSKKKIDSILFIAPTVSSLNKRRRNVYDDGEENDEDEENNEVESDDNENKSESESDDESKEGSEGNKAIQIETNTELVEFSIKGTTSNIVLVRSIIERMVKGERFHEVLTLLLPKLTCERSVRSDRKISKRKVVIGKSKSVVINRNEKTKYKAHTETISSTS